jgi:hypothetical protein
MLIKIRKSLKTYEFLEIEDDIQDLGEAKSIYEQLNALFDEYNEAKPQAQAFHQVESKAPAGDAPACKFCNTPMSWSGKKNKYYCKPCVDKWLASKGGQ